MPQQAGSDNTATSDSIKWKQYAAGTHDFVADSNGSTCARLVILLAAGDLTAAYGPKGADGGSMPLTGLPAGYRHHGSTSGVTTTAAIVVYW
jgi:hypothetical protein